MTVSTEAVPFGQYLQAVRQENSGDLTRWSIPVMLRLAQVSREARAEVDQPGRWKLVANQMDWSTDWTVQQIKAAVRSLFGAGLIDENLSAQQQVDQWKGLRAQAGAVWSAIDWRRADAMTRLGYFYFGPKAAIAETIGKVWFAPDEKLLKIACSASVRIDVSQISRWLLSGSFSETNLALAVSCLSPTSLPVVEGMEQPIVSAGFTHDSCSIIAWSLQNGLPMEGLLDRAIRAGSASVAQMLWQQGNQMTLHELAGYELSGRTEESQSILVSLIAQARADAAERQMRVRSASPPSSPDGSASASASEPDQPPPEKQARHG